MNTSKFTSLACCIAVMALSSVGSSFGADSKSTAKSSPPAKSEATGETWQSLTLKAKQQLHITDKEVAERAKLKQHLPTATPDELQKGRIAITKAAKLALDKLVPLSALKDKQTADDVMGLITSIGYINAMDAVTVATIFADYKKATDKQHQLAVMRQIQVISDRTDALTKDAVAIVEKAFGRDKNAQLQFKDSNFKTSQMHDFVVEMEKAGATTHKAKVDMDDLIKSLEQDAALEKNASAKGKEASTK